MVFANLSGNQRCGFSKKYANHLNLKKIGQKILINRTRIMNFDILTIFPAILDSYFKEGVVGRAVKNKKINIQTHNLRDWTKDKHRTVDDTPYGGGAGMVLKIEPIALALKDLKKKDSKRTRTILFSAKGTLFNQKKAQDLSSYERLIFVCGRYEGVDERVVKHLVDEEISIGEFVLSGGELAAAVLIDSVSRLLPGVLGNEESLIEESFQKKGMAEYPQYTKPEDYKGWKVPPVLLSGNHSLIRVWREKQNKKNNGKKTSR
jgi:tRNA (guanine37-N1)-methyltransferase